MRRTLKTVILSLLTPVTPPILDISVCNRRFVSKMSASLDLKRVESLRQNLTPIYPFNGPPRKVVPPHFVSWEVEWEDYNPPSFTIPGILEGDKPWADPKIEAWGVDDNPTLSFNEKDGGVDRRSYEGIYAVDINGFPLNPMGRTGLAGRGSLGRWGPNHAADCIVTRFKKGGSGSVIANDGVRDVQFIAIRRQDSGELLAIPGGMVDLGEEPLDAAKREFIEEVIGGTTMEDLEAELKADLLKVFENHVVVAKTYVDDRRNTDNAWIETFATHFHIPPELASLNRFDKMNFEGGSDAKAAFWVDYSSDLKMYASHGDLLQKAIMPLLQ